MEDLNNIHFNLKIPEFFIELIKTEVEKAKDTYENAFMYFLNHGYGIIRVLVNNKKTIFSDVLKAYDKDIKYNTYTLETTIEIKKEIDWFIDILNDELKLPKEFLYNKLIEIGIKYYMEGLKEKSNK